MKYSQKQLRKMPKEAILELIENWADARLHPQGTYLDDDAEKWERECMDLWDILTALRGPDDGSHALKMRTTAFIRGKTLPILCAGVGALHIHEEVPFDVTKLCDLLKERTKAKNTVADHFVKHFFMAAKTLKLVKEDVADEVYYDFDKVDDV